MGEHRFHTPGPVELAVKIPVGEIDVQTVDGEESLITVEGADKLVELTEVRQDGDRLVVELRGKKPFGITISIGDFSFGNNRLDIKAKVPHSSAVELATASADAKVRGRIRSLDSKTASGDLRIDADIEDDAAIKTVSGDVRLHRVGGELRVQSVSGDVIAQFVGGSVAAKSVSGDLRLESVREGEVTAQSVSGDIDVGVAEGTNLDVDAGSVSGDLTSEVPLGSDPGEAAGDGPLLVVRGKTVSGDFRVFRGQ
jgi:Toastrack DUF4097